MIKSLQGSAAMQTTLSRLTINPSCSKFPVYVSRKITKLVDSRESYCSNKKGIVFLDHHVHLSQLHYEKSQAKHDNYTSNIISLFHNDVNLFNVVTIP